MDDPEYEASGLLAAGKRILRSVGDLAQSRLDLFLVELKEERIRLFDALFLLAACVVCGLMALALLTLAIVVIFWDEHRVLVLALLTLAYGGGASGAFWTLRNRLRHWQSFTTTLEQIKKDRACLEKQS